MVGLDDLVEGFAVGIAVEVAVLPAGVVGAVGGKLGLHGGADDLLGVGILMLLGVERDRRQGEKKNRDQRSKPHACRH